MAFPTCKLLEMHNPVKMYAPFIGIYFKTIEAQYHWDLKVI